MIIVTLNNKVYLVNTVAEKEGVTTLKKTNELCSDKVTPSEIASYLQKEALGTLTNTTLTGQVSLQQRELTAPEKITVDHAKAQYKLAEAQAMPELINKTFRSLVGA
jgi:hypothetical protein